MGTSCLQMIQIFPSLYHGRRVFYLTHKGPSCKIKKGIYKISSPPAGLFLCIKKLHADVFCEKERQ